MSSLIKNLRIQNFKSIKDLSLDCERINVFIGKPNAGKSNILEAVSLLGVNYPPQNSTNLKFGENAIRYKSLNHLFSDFNFRNPIEISINNHVSAILKEANEQGYDFVFQVSTLKENPDEVFNYNFPSIQVRLYSNGTIAGSSSEETNPPSSPIKRYEFAGLIETNKNGHSLRTPQGDNFYSIIESHPALREEVKRFLEPNGLQLLLDIENQRITVVQTTEDTLISFPLVLVPDTFQRYIFHLAAIMSNRDSVLLFEEPESHSYGPYIYELAQHMLNDEGGNQFFLTTHNPYLLLPLMKEMDDVAIFTTWFENYETHARRLTEQELQEIADYGIDLFYNIDHFIP
ncbi:MAG TPA: AAA family ATPase [Saprospiraceae bacterium]|nr:AAA family ATPase [Saprospiraceae bacterium]HPI07511.1 AAA family ATPase [Saprospiraceae bacterium]